MTTTQDDLTLDLDEEVRLAVVLYGGASLAIYLYGVTEELWRLVRSTCPDRPYSIEDPATAIKRRDDESTEPVYREVARARHGGGPVKRRFVVDIVAGTSAGGINGVCLATALANETSLAGLKDVWVKAGDLSTLLNDEQSVLVDGQPIPNLTYAAPPVSVLNGRRMLSLLVDALRGMSIDPEERPSSPLVDELDLFVTATDLDGVTLPIRLSNVTTKERRHANRYHFRFFRRQDGDAGGEPDRNDFDRRSIDFLAYAARSTSAFPFAFEPMRLDTLPPLAELGSWDAFYPDYAGAAPPFAQRAFSDGGILDNKPFTYATDTLVRRRAPLPVDRKLIYIEPDPAELDALAAPPAPAPPAENDWNAIETAQAALMGIPRSETIRQDIQAVVARNRDIVRIREIVARAGADGGGRDRTLARLAEPSNESWAAKPLSAIVGDPDLAWGPGYAPYHRLKVAATIDYLTHLVVLATQLDPESDEAWAVRQLVAAWKEERYDEEGTGGRATDTAFLVAYDVPFRTRRVAFVFQKLKELQSGDADAQARLLAAAGLDVATLPADADARAVFARLRLSLGEAQGVLNAVEQAAASREGPIEAARSQLGLTKSSLAPLLNAGSDAARAAATADLLASSRTGFGAAAAAIAAASAAALATARAKIEEALGRHFSTRTGERPATLEETLRYVLRFHYDGFEAYDLVLFPLVYATPLGETNPVDIVRISPADARALNDEIPAPNLALMGRGLNHFAAFLDARWRRHDMALGRLQGAECLIRALAPADRADELVRRAQDRILGDYSEEVTGERRADPRAWFKNEYVVAASPEPPPLDTARRASPIVVTILQDILNRRSRIGGTVWETLSKALPDRPGGAVAVTAALRVLLKLSAFRIAALAIVLPLLVLFVGGIALAVAADGGWRALGIVAALFAVGVGVALWVAALKLVSFIRTFVRRRVDAFLGPLAGPPPT